MKNRQTNTLGKAARQQIIRHAEQLLICGGYHELSTRKVADACGISLGNLTYHYPNKKLLVEAVMEDVCNRYEKERVELTPREPQTPREYLQKLLRLMLDDAVTHPTSALFVELWVLAKHHDFGRDIIERLYQTVAGWITDSLTHYFPNQSRHHCLKAAYFLLTLSEGTVAVFSRPGDRPVTHSDIGEFAVAGVLQLLDP